MGDIELLEVKGKNGGKVFLDREKIVSMSRYKLDKEIKRCRNSPLYFIQNYLKVKPKRGHETVKFKLNKVQKMIYKAIKLRFFKPYAKLEDGTVLKRFQDIRVIIVKYRQVGVSTLIVALILHDILFFKNTSAILYLHKKEKAKEMLERMTNIYDSLPSKMKPKKSSEDGESSTLWKFAKSKSKVSVSSPGTSKEIAGDQGRSETYNDVLISELPRYRYQAEFLQAVLAAAKEGNVYIESTPLIKGDVFHNKFITAIDPDSDSEWLGLFFPWFIDPLNETELHSEEEEYQILGDVTEDDQGKPQYSGLTPNEQWLFDNHGDLMNARKIKWRRKTILDDFEGNERRFMQEYPEDIERAFSAHGFNFFEDDEFDIKQKSILDFEIPRNREQIRNTLRIRAAVPGRLYAMGVDTAKGVGGKGDFSVISVIDPVTQELVYRWRSNTKSSKLLHEKIYEVWKEYQSVVGIEINGQTGGEVMTMCRSDPQLKEDLLFQKMLYRTSRKWDGFYTDFNSKSKLMNSLYAALKAAVKTYVIEKDSPVAPVGLRHCDPVFTSEMGTCIEQDGHIGSIEGSGNHDDIIISVGIAWFLVQYIASFIRLYNRSKSNELQEVS